ncbi:hypothetical protein SAMN05920897_11061 [Alkalispirochaeta americana]|uniref:Phosphatidylglycerol lysyltransferase C-terminal domain-containing protein n=1 Tax=Alkalispirochaeta americana TaxID=159291 RepID=A0A1N6THF7_9SPIO|nr:phosphatidylglycerol lysyltransferase domain-containing protein [Alkalispirochaeta americana]SIQ52775.1 hypothetical protein SAMN05920897_11061 [Alkalispirochaeta americana]
MTIPRYPDVAPLSFSQRDALHPRLALLPEGISEFTFAGLYLFRDTYAYRVSSLPGDHLVVAGEREGSPFCMLPCGLPQDPDLLGDLLGRFGYIKGLGEPQADESWVWLEQQGYTIQEDRDNFDYLYLRTDLAELAGKRYHKKRNHVNAFINNYLYDERPLTPENREDALSILERWQASREDRNDYIAAREALERFQELDLRGYLVYVDNEPAAYTLGEPLMKGRSFVVHFEKALDHYRGIYQFINKAFATILPRHYTWINREQDLGDPGLRQAKMTYRPWGFVKKYRVTGTTAGNHG